MFQSCMILCVCVSLNLIVVDLELQVRFGVYESVYERLFKEKEKGTSSLSLLSLFL